MSPNPHQKNAHQSHQHRNYSVLLKLFEIIFLHINQNVGPYKTVSFERYQHQHISTKTKGCSTVKEFQKQELNQRICFSFHLYVPSMKSFPFQNLLPSLLVILVVNLNNVGHVFTCYVIVFPPPPKNQEFENSLQALQQNYSAFLKLPDGLLNQEI